MNGNRGFNFLKSETCLCRSQLSIMVICFIVISVVLLICYDHTPSKPKSIHKKDLGVILGSERLITTEPSVTRGDDYYDPVNDISEEEKLIEDHHQTVTSPNRPIQVKRRKLSDKSVNAKRIQNYESAEPGITATHINGILMEPVYANYNRNIYFTVKSTNANTKKRLFPLLLTWLQVVDKNKVRHCLTQWLPMEPLCSYIYCKHHLPIL